jgi:hypothetical protein
MLVLNDNESYQAKEKNLSSPHQQDLCLSNTNERLDPYLQIGKCYRVHLPGESLLSPVTFGRPSPNRYKTQPRSSPLVEELTSHPTFLPPIQEQ